MDRRQFLGAASAAGDVLARPPSFVSFSLLSVYSDDGKSRSFAVGLPFGKAERIGLSLGDPDILYVDCSWSSRLEEFAVDLAAGRLLVGGQPVREVVGKHCWVRIHDPEKDNVYQDWKDILESNPWIDPVSRTSHTTIKNLGDLVSWEKS